MAILFLASFPRFWGDMHFNPKDVPVTIFIGFVIMGYLSWYENPNLKKALLVGILFGSALGIKANAAFTPLICLIGIWPWSIKNKFWQTNFEHLKKYFPHYLIMGFGTIVTYFLSWPFLYENPARVLLHIEYIASQGGRTGILKR